MHVSSRKDQGVGKLTRSFPCVRASPFSKMNDGDAFQAQNETYDLYNDSSASSNASEVLQSADSGWPEFRLSNQIWVIAGWLIIIVGSIGHFLTIGVLLGSKRMRLLSITVYLVANSLAGLAVLYVGLLRQVILHHSDVDVRDLTSDIGCGLHAALTYMSLQLFSWLQATIAVERTVAVIRPLHYKRWCTWRRNVIVVVSVVMLLGTLNAIVGSVYHVNEKGQCAEAEDQKELFENVWGYIDLLLFSLFPIAVIVPCNVLTLHTVYRSRKESRSSGRKYLQLTIMLLAQNCVCVATTLPISVLFLVPLPTEPNSAESARRELEWTALSLLQYLGTMFGFFIYSTSARRFRRSIADLFVKRCDRKQASLSGLSSSQKTTRECMSFVRQTPGIWTPPNGFPFSAVSSLTTEVQTEKV